MGGWEEVEHLDQKIKEEPKNSSFIFKEASNTKKKVVTIYGEKGSGKTMTALGLKGLKAVICFDNKAQVIKENFFKGDQNVKVYDATEYFTKEPEHFLESSKVTYEYVMFLLDNIKSLKPDWIIIDGTEILNTICEMIMRKNNGLRPYQGISNMGIWKERRQLVDSVHRKTLNCAKEGVVYTTYFDDDKVIEEGAIVTSKKVPKWVDTILYETDITLHVENKVDKNGFRVIVKVNNSKIPSFLKTGQILDLTDKKLSDFTKGE